MAQLQVTHSINTYTTDFYMQIKNNPAVQCFFADHLP